MEELLKQILSELKFTNEILNSIQAEIKDVNRKTSAIFDQTSEISEFKTIPVETLNKIEADITFLIHKEVQTEKAIFNINRRFLDNR